MRRVLLVITVALCTAGGAGVACTLAAEASTPAKITATVGWGDGTRIDHDRYAGLTSVSCPTADFCITVDSDGTNGANSFVLRGTTWSGAGSVRPPAGTTGTNVGLESVSCPSADFCAAVGGAVGEDGQNSPLTVLWNGSHWSTPSVWTGSAWALPSTFNTPGSPLDSVSCASAMFCVAIAEDGDTTTWNGAQWTAPTSIGDGADWTDTGATISDLNLDPTNVSCGSAQSCVATGTSGEVVLWNGTNWSAPVDVDPGAGFDSVSCPSSTFCAATVSTKFKASTVESGATHIAFVTWNGSSWSALTHPTGIKSSAGFEAAHVSCASSTYCIAADPQGNTAQFNGSRWTISEPPFLWDAKTGPSAPQAQGPLSCPSAGICFGLGLSRGGNGDQNDDAFELGASEMTLKCSPSTIAPRATTACTATVRDPTATTATAPTGIVTFPAMTIGDLRGYGRCTLKPTGKSATSSCTRVFRAGSLSAHEAGFGNTLYASYDGDASHPGTNGYPTEGTGVMVTRHLHRG